MAKKSGPKSKKGPRKKPAPREVSTAYLADMLGLSEMRISELTKEGMPKSGRSRFPTRDAVRWYVEYLRGRQQQREEAGPTRGDVQRDLDVLKLKKALAEVFDAQEVLDTTRGAYTRLGAEHEARATRIGRELNLPGEDVKMIRDMTDEMRARFVKDMKTFIDVVEPPKAEDGSDSSAAA
jgi:hypothetical protein